MAGEYSTLRRGAWVWMEDRFIAYPFQNNIRELEPQTVFECLVGAVEVQRAAGTATPVQRMGFNWIGERASVVNVEDLLRNVLFEKPETPWGPNSTFNYPLRGGTGHLYEGMSRSVEHRLELSCPVVSVDPSEQLVHTADGRRWPYDVLLSTMPLNRLMGSMEGVPDAVRRAAGQLEWSGSHIVDIGVDRPTDSDKNWIYFPEGNVPFYRVTYLSNYSPYLTPADNQVSLLTETAYSRYKTEDPATIVDRVVEGLTDTGLLDDDDRGRIVSRWLCSPAQTYPVPTLARDDALGTIQPWLRSQRIYSRGRFGAWLYEIGNMDHSTMQRVEFVNRVLQEEPETVWIPRGEGVAGAGIR